MSCHMSHAYLVSLLDMEWKQFLWATLVDLPYNFQGMHFRDYFPDFAKWEDYFLKLQDSPPRNLYLPEPEETPFSVRLPLFLPKSYARCVYYTEKREDWVAPTFYREANNYSILSKYPSFSDELKEFCVTTTYPYFSSATQKFWAYKVHYPVDVDDNVTENCSEKSNLFMIFSAKSATTFPTPQGKGILSKFQRGSGIRWRVGGTRSPLRRILSRRRSRVGPAPEKARPLKAVKKRGKTLRRLLRKLSQKGVEKLKLIK